MRYRYLRFRKFLRFSLKIEKALRLIEIITNNDKYRTLLIRFSLT